MSRTLPATSDQLNYGYIQLMGLDSSNSDFEMTLRSLEKRLHIYLFLAIENVDELKV